MKVKRCRDCAAYLNEDNFEWWCPDCDYTETKAQIVRYIDDD